MVPAVWSWHCRGMQPLQALREFGAGLLSFSSTEFATGKGNSFLGEAPHWNFRNGSRSTLKGMRMLPLQSYFGGDF